MKITRKYLSNYSCLESRIKSIKRRLRYFDSHPLTASHGVVKGSMAEFPYAECQFIVGGAEPTSARDRDTIVSQLIVDLRRNEQLFEDMKLGIELLIENEEELDLEEQTILRLKYVDGFTDAQIGMELGYDRSTISKKIDKIIEKCEVSHKSQS